MSNPEPTSTEEIEEILDNEIFSDMQIMNLEECSECNLNRKTHLKRAAIKLASWHRAELQKAKEGGK